MQNCQTKRAKTVPSSTEEVKIKLGPQRAVLAPQECMVKGQRRRQNAYLDLCANICKPIFAKKRRMDDDLHRARMSLLVREIGDSNLN